MIYELHFERPISPEHSCQHYLGWAPDEGLDARLAEHAAGRGARLTQVALERGIRWVLARTWRGTRADERRLKQQKNGRRLCPVCAGGEPVIERPRRRATWIEHHLGDQSYREPLRYADLNDLDL